MDNNQHKTVEYRLTKGELFRIAGPTGISPEVWTWDGKYQMPEREEGYICRRLSDGFTTVLYPFHTIVPLDPPEDI